MTPDVRTATLADEDGIMALCRANHAENGAHPFNEVHTRSQIRRVLSGQDGGVIGVVGEEGALRACICILLDRVWYSDQHQLLELFNFVHPDHRRSTYAKQLLLFARRCADETGLDLTIGVLSDTRMEAKVRLYTRVFPKAGEFFVYQPERGQ